MTKAIPITPTTMANKTWRRSPDYRFATTKIVCPIDYTEASKVCASMPLGFIKVDQTYHLVAVNGLTHELNLLVDASGRWMSDYVPLEYRLYPFLLAQVDSELLALCIDEESGLISDPSQGESFFDGGKPTPTLNRIMEALTTRHKQRLYTQRIVQQLSDNTLLKEWQLKYTLNGEEGQLKGLHCVDEAALATISGDQLRTLRDSGALALFYCQMFSMQQLQYLLKLTTFQRGAQPETATSSDTLKFAGVSSDTTLNFDNF